MNKILPTVLLAFFVVLLNTSVMAEPVQWKAEDGGNGHWYDVIVVPDGITWTVADATTKAMGGGWHLATITSAGENDFVYNLVKGKPEFWRRSHTGNSHGPWLGGIWVGPGVGDYEWITGEPFVYTNWGPSEPFGNGRRIGLFGHLAPDGPYWNDIGPDRLDVVSYVIETTISPFELRISTEILSVIKLGEFSSQTLEASGGVAPYSWSIVAGALPLGMELSEDGVISGTPTEAGEFTFTVKVIDSNGEFAEKEFTLKVMVTLPPPDIRISKSGTTAVPGRILDYFAVIENVGDTTAVDIKLTEIIEPWFTYISSNPLPSNITQGLAPFPDFSSEDTYDQFIEWTIPVLNPGEIRILSYKVELDPAFPIGETVTGTWCITPDEAEKCATGLTACYTGSIIVCTGRPDFVTCVLKRWYGICLLGYAVCMSNYNLPCGMFPQKATQPIDPNEKLVVANTYIQPDQILIYPIHFENIGDVEARDIFIKDVLDNNLDIDSINVFTADGQLIPLPVNETVTIKELEKVRIIEIDGQVIETPVIETWNVSLDGTNRTIQWELLNVDLPPGATDSVLFSIYPIPGLASGTEIRNSAEIQFEIFEPLVTPEVVNIIDSTPPTGIMNPLPAETTSSEFEISWSGTDAIGEIESYTILVSVDGGNFEPFLEKTQETSATFTGKDGKTYGFICIATDTAGNIEVQEAVAETVTTVAITVVDTTPPEISVSVSPDTLWPPNHKMIPVSMDVSVSDNCDADPDIVLISVVSSEPDDARGGGDGHTTNDIQDADIGTEDYNISLRAERQGKGHGRIYTITYEATDASGNNATASATVTVPHNQ